MQDGADRAQRSAVQARAAAGRVKVLMGVGRGRKAHDKRQKLKAATARREIETALRGRTRGGR